MTLRRAVFLLLMVLLLACVAAGIFARQFWLNWQQANGIQRIDWNHVTLAKHGLQIESLSLVQARPEQNLELELHHLQLRWSLGSQGQSQWPWLQIETAVVDQISFRWQPSAKPAQSKPFSFDKALESLDHSLGNLAKSDGGPFWLPLEIRLRQIEGHIPCGSDFCPVIGEISLERAAGLFPVEVELKLQQDDRSLLVTGEINGSLQGFSTSPIDLQLSATIDGAPVLSLATQYSKGVVSQSVLSKNELSKGPVQSWSGAIELTELTQIDNWLVWLGQWMVVPDLPLQPNRLALDWSLGWPQSSAFWDAVEGTVSVQAKVDDYGINDVNFQGIDLALDLTGKFSPGDLDLISGPGSRLELSHAKVQEKGKKPVVDARGIKAGLAGLQFYGQYDPEQKRLQQPSLSGPVELAVAQLNQANIKSQSWRLKGQLQAGPEQIEMDAKLSSDTKANIKASLNYDFALGLNGGVNWSTGGFEGGQVLSETLVDWPDLLSLENGNLSTSLSFFLEPDKPLRLTGRMEIDALDGTYDRATWSGLSSRLDFRLLGSRLELELNEFELSQINPGIPVGPLRVRGGYVTDTHNLAAGRLQLSRFTGGFTGGNLELAPGVWQTHDFPLQARLTLNQLQLEELLALYPTEGLAGKGEINGELPLTIMEQGVVIAQGKVAADKAGGTLQISPRQLQSLGQSNKAMAQVVAALDDFHYTVLSSTVDYSKDGILTLGLHLEGQNPELENKQRYNFNITLEDDIPALLTSLQLSGRVSDAVAERVKRLLEKDGSGD